MGAAAASPVGACSVAAAKTIPPPHSQASRSERAPIPLPPSLEQAASRSPRSRRYRPEWRYGLGQCFRPEAKLGRPGSGHRADQTAGANPYCSGGANRGNSVRQRVPTGSQTGAPAFETATSGALRPGVASQPELCLWSWRSLPTAVPPGLRAARRRPRVATSSGIAGTEPSRLKSRNGYPAPSPNFANPKNTSPSNHPSAATLPNVSKPLTKKRHRLRQRFQARQSRQSERRGESIAKPAFENAATENSLTPKSHAPGFRQAGCIPFGRLRLLVGFHLLATCFATGIVDGIHADSPLHNQTRCGITALTA